MKNISFYKPIALFCVSILASVSLKAQVSDCSIFLLGDEIEAGVNWNGALGASTSPPTGSHANWSTSLYNSPRCSGTLYTGISLGVIADPDEDGWTTGATPFYGDFILPGGANEGWSLMFNGTQINGWNSDAAFHDSIDNVSAYLYDYTNIDGVKSAKTQANYNGVYLTQWVNLDTTKLYMTVQVLIENTALAAASDVYYMRMVNPHNDQSLSTNPNTWNKIEAAFPDTGNRAIVSSHGNVYNNAYMAMATKDDRASAFLGKHAQLPNVSTIDYIAFGDTNYLFHSGDSVYGNNCMGLVYNLGLMNSGMGALITLYYVFRPDVVDDAIYSNHLAVSNLQSSGNTYMLLPNPVNEHFKVSGLLRTDKIEIYDIMGRMLPFADEGNEQFNVSNLSTGSYIVVVRNPAGLIKARLRLQKL